MSLSRREELAEQIVEAQPALGAFVREVPRLENLVSWNWDALSYGFQRAFETLWDHAYADHTGLLLHPLLMLWRQSVELALKAAITENAGKIVGKPGHNLEALFEQLLTVRAERGFSDDDELAESVRAMVALVQSVDPFADRFRYPTAKGGKPFEAVDADLERLFQAQWTIVVYCEGAALEVEESRSAQN
jgi:HEPN domain-containing protein